MQLIALADIRTGRLLDVPAWLWCSQAVTLIVHQGLVHSADKSGRRHFALSSLRFFTIGTLTSQRLASDVQASLHALSGFGYLGRRVASGIQISTHIFISVCVCSKDISWGSHLVLGMFLAKEDPKARSWKLKGKEGCHDIRAEGPQHKMLT